MLKPSKLLQIILVFAVVAFFYACKSGITKKIITKTDANGYQYEMVNGDPLKARIYTLKNGLKVYLAQNTDAPRILTLIAVRAGSKNDPRETTGLAHYFEHIMFKGTNEIGTLNWQEEQKYLAQISDLFEQHKATNDTNEKKLIYHQIDSISQIASTLAVANEYDKAVSLLGAQMTNAFTSYDLTAYINEIPSNELERWLKLECERFTDPVFRLFHTELETVYEEFNMGQDYDDEISYNAAVAELFKNHPYGIDVIGKGEHLKNPSMVNIQKFKEQYYVANNMAICLMGDLNFEETIKKIDKEWGAFKTNPNLKEEKFAPELEINSPIEKEVFGPDKEYVEIYFRAPGKKAVETNYLELISQVLNNSRAGLIDLNLIKNQKIQKAYCYLQDMNDYCLFTFRGYPRSNQSLQEVKELLLAELNKVKQGQFEDWMLEAIVNDKELQQIEQYDNNWAVFSFLDAFISNTPWIDKVNYLDELRKISKKQIVDFANKFFKGNYVVIYKKTGENKNKMLVEKPPIKKIELNRNEESKYMTAFKNLKPEAIKPVFVDYKKELQISKLSNGVDFYYRKNTTNPTAYLYFSIDMGKLHHRKLPLAIDYLNFIGTNQYSFDSLSKEFYRLGISYSTWSSDERSYVYIFGLDKNLSKGLELIEHLLNNAKPEQDKYEKFVEKLLKDRENAKLEKQKILSQAMFNYAKYGANNPFNSIIPNDELKKINPKELTDLIKEVFNYQHMVFYYGPKEKNEAEKMLMQFHKPSTPLKVIPEYAKFNELDINENTILFCNYDMVQAQIRMIAKDKIFDSKELPVIEMFNQYYNGAMSSIVFQEIRESEGLAYASYAGYTTPQKAGRSNYVQTYIATQPDKLETALNKFNVILNEMVMSEKTYNDSRQALINAYNTERITKDNVFWYYIYNKDKGIEYDYRKDVYEQIQNMPISAINEFFNTHIKGKKYVIALLAKKEKVDFKKLSQFGKIKEVTLNELFGY